MRNSNRPLRLGDEVITADSNGLVNFLKPVAQSMTGWGKEYSHQRSTRTRTYR